MIKHVWSVLCKESVIQQDNVLSIRDILESLTIEVKPLVSDAKLGQIYPFNAALEFEICSYLEKTSLEKESGVIRLTIIRPDGKTEKEFENPFEIPRENDAFRFRNKMQGLTVYMPGKYYFVVDLKPEGSSVFNKVAELPLKISVTPSED
jgi:hypothetical protein